MSPLLDWADFRAVLDDAATALDIARPRLAELEGVRELIIYSYGARGTELAGQLRARGMTCRIFDNAPAARARALADGFDLAESPDERLPLIVAAGQNQIEILSGLYRRSYSLAEALYALDLRNSYGAARAFTDEIVPNAVALFDVYRRLDPASAAAFLDVLAYRASLEVMRMVNRRPMAEMWRPPIEGLDVRSFCDLGSYDGDSLAAVKAVFPRLERAFCVEPTPAMADRIKAVGARLGVETQVFTGAAWSRPARLGARTIFNGMMVIDEQAAGDIAAEPLDALVGDQVYDYFKFDVEGSEAQGLSGGALALRRSRCVSVAAYHLPNDLIDLAERLSTLLPEAEGWRLAFAHYSQTFEDSFLYAVRSPSGTE